jgi:hypothetical protein
LKKYKPKKLLGHKKMKNTRDYLFAVCLIAMVGLSGCSGTETGVKVTLKQVIPITPTTTIEISKSIENISTIVETPSQNYVLENTQFAIPFQIENKDNSDYSNVAIRLKIESNLLEIAYPYSYSGQPLSQLQNGFYSVGTNLLARQTNQFLLIGKVGNLPMNLTSAELNFEVELYSMSTNQPIANTLSKEKIKICKQANC